MLAGGISFESFSKIDDLLYLGDRVAAMDLELLKRNEIRSVVQVQSTDEPPFHPDEFDYHGITISDSSGESLSKALPDAVKFIHRAVSQRQKVFIHCDAGISRSPSILAAYLMASRHWSFEKALAFIRKSRSIVCPNGEFREQLQSIEASTMSQWLEI